MKIYIRDKDDDFIDAWYSLTSFVENEPDFEGTSRVGYKERLHELIAEWGGQLCDNFWNISDGEFINFDRDADATAFLLRWS
jgi:hypothetical protein